MTSAHEKADKDNIAKIRNLEDTLKNVNHKCQRMTKDNESLKTELKSLKILLTKSTRKLKSLSKETQVDVHAFELPVTPQKAIDIILSNDFVRNHKNGTIATLLPSWPSRAKF